jgi:uncharacterized protein (DUF488 family)
MMTDEFRQGVSELLGIAQAGPTTIMCAEAMFWQCHRRLVSDYLSANDVAVQHIFSTGEIKPHKLTPGAWVKDGTVTYPGKPTLFDMDEP